MPRQKLIIKVPSTSAQRNSIYPAAKSAATSVKKLAVKPTSKHVLPSSTGGSDLKEWDNPTSSKTLKFLNKKPA
jgi:hypothetical protein